MIVFTIFSSQSELENLSFMYTNAQDYAKIKRRVAELLKEHEKELVEVQTLSLCLCLSHIEFFCHCKSTIWCGKYHDLLNSGVQLCITPVTPAY